MKGFAETLGMGLIWHLSFVKLIILFQFFYIHFKLFFIPLSWMGKIIENYSILEQLGEGVYGKVYKAVHMKTK